MSFRRDIKERLDEALEHARRGGADQARLDALADALNLMLGRVSPLFSETLEDAYALAREMNRSLRAGLTEREAIRAAKARLRLPKTSFYRLLETAQVLRDFSDARWVQIGRSAPSQEPTMARKLTTGGSPADLTPKQPASNAKPAWVAPPTPRDGGGMAAGDPNKGNHKLHIPPAVPGPGETNTGADAAKEAQG